MTGWLDAEICEVFDLYAIGRGCLAPGIHDGLLSDLPRDESIDGADVIGHVVVEGGAGLYLAQGKFAIRLRDEIDFRSAPVADEIQVRGNPLFSFALKASITTMFSKIAPNRGSRTICACSRIPRRWVSSPTSVKYIFGAFTKRLPKFL